MRAQVPHTQSTFISLRSVHHRASPNPSHLHSHPTNPFWHSGPGHPHTHTHSECNVFFIEGVRELMLLHLRLILIHYVFGHCLVAVVVVAHSLPVALNQSASRGMCEWGWASIAASEWAPSRGPPGIRCGTESSGAIYLHCDVHTRARAHVQLHRRRGAAAVVCASGMLSSESTRL